MKEVRIHKRWNLLLPEGIADWDVWEYWELPRVSSIERELKPGNILFDIGAEHGWQSALYSSLGLELVLFEPTPQFWPNIRAIWEANHLSMPLRCFIGLVGAETHYPDTVEAETHLYRIEDVWPKASEAPLSGGDRPYRYLHVDNARSPQITLDDWVDANGIIPDGITIDVEGSEFKVLAGARELLLHARPKVWVSVHPDLMEKHHNDHPSDIYALMSDLGYTEQHLVTDHETHMFYEPA